MQWTPHLRFRLDRWMVSAQRGLTQLLPNLTLRTRVFIPRSLPLHSFPQAASSLCRVVPSHWPISRHPRRRMTLTSIRILLRLLLGASPRLYLPHVLLPSVPLPGPLPPIGLWLSPEQRRYTGSQWSQLLCPTPAGTTRLGLAELTSTGGPQSLLTAFLGTF